MRFPGGREWPRRGRAAKSRGPVTFRGAEFRTEGDSGKASCIDRPISGNRFSDEGESFTGTVFAGPADSVRTPARGRWAE